MFKIGDFSRLSRVTVKTLRYYDEIGLLKPAAIDQFTGYRYYTAEQLDRLSRIVILKEAGLSLEEISSLLTVELSIHRIKDILLGRRTEIRHQMQDAGDRLSRLDRLLKQLEKEGKMPEYQVSLKKVEPMQIASIREVVPGYADSGRLYGELYAYLGKAGVSPSGPPIVILYDHEYKEKDVDVEAAVPVSREITESGRIKVSELPGVLQMACVLYKGGYEGISEAYQALMDWIENNGFAIAGNSREVYVQGPGQTQDTQSYVTEVQFPVEKQQAGNRV